MGSALGGFAAGLLAGLDRGMVRKKEDERLAAKDARETEIYESAKRDRDRREQDDIALRQAGAPVTVQQGTAVDFGDGQQHGYEDAGVAGSDVRQANRMAEQAGADSGPIALSKPAPMVAGKVYGDQGSADKAAAKANEPGAQAERIASTLRSQGKVTEAMKYQEAAQKFADAQWDRDVRQAMTRGHEGIAEMLTKSEAGPFAGKMVRAVPNPDGKTVTYNIVGPDGSMTPTPYTFPADEKGIIQAGYGLSRIDPEVRYRHMVEEDKLAAENKRKDADLKLRERNLDEVKVPLAEARIGLSQAQATAAEAKAEAAAAKAAAGGGTEKVDRENRMRWTTLHGEAGRRLSDANKALRALVSDPSFMVFANKKGSPQAQQLEEVRSDIETYKKDRELYGELLAGEAGKMAKAAREGGAAAPAPAPAPGGATKVPPGTQAERDTDRVQILKGELAKAQERAATGDARAKQDVDALTREIAAASKKAAPVKTSAPAAPAKAAGQPGASRNNPVTGINDAAARDALEPGTFYQAPNGQVYVKR